MAVATKVVEVKRVKPRGWNPAPATPAGPVDPVTAAENASARFGHFVRNNLEGPILRYSHRLTLLKEAERMGVGRFEANLVIAKILSEQGMGQEVEWAPDRKAGGWKLPLAAFAVIQTAVLVGVWWLMRL